jgi:AmmeMemoRadiSam system protein B/AmmeMemoRadiSam system protein A
MQKNLRRYLLTFMGGVIVINFSITCNANPQEKVRPAANADAFYPAEPKVLADMIDQFLVQARTPALSGTISGVVVPHAGYVYSGPVAAYSYALLKNKKYSRVVVISPSHVAAFRGSAVYDGTAYDTPLGRIEVDQQFCRELVTRDNSLKLSVEGHETIYQGRMEHALEVQLPFLQRVLNNFKLVPIIMGEQSYECCRALGRALASTITDDQTIIVASSDLSHYHSYDEAKALDSKVLKSIEEWDYFNLCRNLKMNTWEACGGGPITALMIAAEQQGANTAKVIKYATSGDVPVGEKSRVVGYAAVVLYKDVQLKKSAETGFNLGDKEKKYLLELARKSVDSAVRNNKMIDCTDGGFKDLSLDRGAFVTLTIQGQLRGCIGYTSPFQSLYLTVRDVAFQAALHDPRFPAVSERELSKLNYEISVLSPLRKIVDINKIEIGKHGLLIKNGRNEGLLLPQVASDYNWDRQTFLQQTCHKAGLPAEAWEDENTDIFSFSALVFGEE